MKTRRFSMVHHALSLADATIGNVPSQARMMFKFKMDSFCGQKSQDDRYVGGGVLLTMDGRRGLWWRIEA